MRILKSSNYINEKLGIRPVTKTRLAGMHVSKPIYTIQPQSRDELLELIRKRFRDYGNGCDFNDIDVSRITDMCSLFKYANFDFDISKWDVSNVTNMSSMFCYSTFNGDISKWNVSNVKFMNYMFRNIISIIIKQSNILKCFLK